MSCVSCAYAAGEKKGDGEARRGAEQGGAGLTEPERRDGRLQRLLVAFLDLRLGLAAARVLVLYELGVPPALFERLGLLFCARERVSFFCARPLGVRDCIGRAPWEGRLRTIVSI